MKSVRQKKTVFVGMSGGVDSSVASYLLKKQGYNVVGVFLRCYNIDGCAEKDAQDARRVAEKIGIPFYVWDFEQEYKKAVVEYMVEGYKAGITPNPDVMCNREIKFGRFWERARACGADFVATGHYARIRNNLLAAAVDTTKDQSYFLWTLRPDQLQHCLFPIGGYKKSKVRAIARRAGLITADKKDSQGICFLGFVDIRDFLKTYIPEKPGPIVTFDGRVVGQHRGAWFYTIGQRHIGANIKVSKDRASSGPYYVVSKNIKTNTIVVAQEKEVADQTTDTVALAQAVCNIPASKISSKKGYPVLARFRYRQPLVRARLKKRQSSKNGAGYALCLAGSQKFIAPGQSAVFYNSKGIVLGGGVIV